MGTPHLLRSHCDSRWYANAIAEYQTLSIDDDSKSIELECPFGDPGMLKIIEPHQVHRELFKRATKPLHIHIRGKLEDIFSDDLPTFTAMHASPNCASTSDLARNHHQRYEEDEFAAVQPEASEASKQWDYVVSHIIRIVRDQRTRELRPGIRNTKFGFTFEQPDTTVSRNHHYVVNMCMPIENGGLGAERDTVDICQLGSSVKKATLFVHSQLPALIHELRKPDGITPKFKCPGLSKHHVHGNVRGDSKAHTAFHPRLAGILATGVFHSFCH